MMSPPTIAGSTNGSVTRNVVRKVPAPRILAASSISEDTRSSAELVNTNTYGKEATATTTIRPVIE